MYGFGIWRGGLATWALALLEMVVAALLVVVLCAVWLALAWLWLGAPAPALLGDAWVADRPISRALVLPIVVACILAPAASLVRGLAAVAALLRGVSPAYLLRPLLRRLDPA